MPNPARSTVRLSVNLSEDQYIQLHEIAAKSEVSLAWIVRKAVQQFLEIRQDPQIPLPMGFKRLGADDV